MSQQRPVRRCRRVRHLLGSQQRAQQVFPAQRRSHPNQSACRAVRRDPRSQQVQEHPRQRRIQEFWPHRRGRHQDRFGVPRQQYDRLDR